MRRTPGSSPLHPTAASFEDQVIRSARPVLVDFWAPWCPPCVMLKPEVERLAEVLRGRAKVAFVNVDEEPELASMFDVTGIPAMMVFKKGRRVDAWTGFVPGSAILARLERHLAK